MANTIAQILRKSFEQPRFLAMRTLAALLVLLAAAGLHAASPVMIFVLIEGDEETNADDTFVTVPLHWEDDEIPVQMTLHRDITGVAIPRGSIEGRDDLTDQINGVPDDVISQRIRDALEAAVEQWNDVPISSFDFEDGVRFSDLILGDPNRPFGPDRVALDRYNLITFINPQLDFTDFDEDENFATTVIFYTNSSFDLTGESTLPAGFRVIEVLEGDGEESDELIVQIQDGTLDELRLERRSYDAGEILDADIVFRQGGPFFLWPDENDLGTITPAATVADTIGTPDIQLLTTRQLGFAMGGDSSLIPTSVMYNNFQSDFETDEDDEPLPGDPEDPSDFEINPYVGRDLDQQLDAQIMAAILYPGDLSGRGTVTGRVFDGAVVENDDTVFGAMIPQVPVYAGRPTELTVSTQPNDILSNRGLIRLEANVLSGLNQVLSGSATQGPIFFSENGDYEMPGLPPASDYGFRIDDAAGLNFDGGGPNVLSEVFNLFDNAGTFTPEWWGGAGLTPVFSENNLPPAEIPVFRSISNDFIHLRIFAGGDGGQFITATNGETFSVPVLPAFAFRIVDSVGNVTESIIADQEDADFSAFQVDDAGDVIQFSFQVENLILVDVTYTLVDLQSAGRPADILTLLDITNLTGGPLTVSTRLAHSPVYGVPTEDDPLPNEVNAAEPLFVNGQLVIQETDFIPAPPTLEVHDNRDSALKIFAFFLNVFGLTPADRLVLATAANFQAAGDVFDVGAEGAAFYEEVIPDGEIPGFAGEAVATSANSSIALLYWLNRPIPAGATDSISTGSGITLYTRLPETGQPFDAADPDFLDDNPFVSEPIAVVAGGITSGIDFITNDGPDLLDPAGTVPGDGGTDPGDDGDDEPTPNEDLPEFDDGNQGTDIVPLDRLVAFGADAGDFDNDGDLDIYFAIGGRSDDPDDDFRALGLSNRLYRNMLKETGRAEFVDITVGDDLQPNTADDFIPIQQDASYHANFADFDGDGWVDIFVSNFAPPAQDTGIPGRQNRLLMNRERVRNGQTERFYVDGTEDFLPGILNFGPNTVYVPFPLLASDAIIEGNFLLTSHFDISTRSAVGDIDGDGDLDIVVSNSQSTFDPVGSFAIWGTSISTPTEFDTINLLFSERILINTLIDKDPALNGTFRFIDDTLGPDQVWGGADPNNLTTGINDRVPPNYSEIPQDAPISAGNNEQDISDTAMVALAPLDGFGNALDLYIGNRKPRGNTVTNGFVSNTSKHAGQDMIYKNFDIDADGVPDGYFSNITGGGDFTHVISFEGNDVIVPTMIQPPDPTNINPIVGTSLNPTAVFEGDSGDAGPPEDDYFQQRTGADTQTVHIMDAFFQGHFQALVITTWSNNGAGGGDQPPFLVDDGGTNATFYYLRSLGGASREYTPDGALNFTSDFLQANSPVLENIGLPQILGRPRAGTVADFNLDGDFDFMAASDEGSTIGPFAVSTSGAGDGFLQFFENDAAGGFSEQTNPLGLDDDQLRLPWFYLRAADFDNDSDDDVLALTLGSGVHVFFNGTLNDQVSATPFNDGDFPLFFDATVRYLPPFAGSSLDVQNPESFSNSTNAADFADFDRDGRLDLIVGRGAFFTTSGDANSLYINTGAPIFNSPRRILKPGFAAQPRPMVLGQFDGIQTGQRRPTSWVQATDLDNDGSPDIYEANYGTPNQIFFNVDIDDPFINSDVDADGEADGVLINRTIDRLPSTSGNPSLELTQHFAFGDINGDGRTDIVTANGPLARNGVFLNNSPTGEPNVDAGLFSENSSNLPFLQDDTRAVVLSDFDGDGDLDLFALNRFRPEQPTSQLSRLYFNNGAGVFTDVTFGADGIPNTADDRLPAILGQISAAVAADFDLAGDATEDLNGNGLLEANEFEFINKNGIIDRRVLPSETEDDNGNGVLDPGEDTGVFQPVNPLNPSLGVVLVGAGNGILDAFDLDGNGVIDNRAGTFRASYDLFITYSDGQNLLLLNNGSGFFTQAPLPAVDDASFAVDIGNIALQTRRDFAVSVSDPSAVVPVDRPLIDILVGNREQAGVGNSVTLLLNNPAAPGTFIDRSREIPVITHSIIGITATSPPPDEISGNVRAVRLGDLDGDGDLDIYLGQTGEHVSENLGAPDWILINRLIGDNLLAQTVQGNPPGLPPIPDLRFILPGRAHPGQELELLIYGKNFRNGAVVDLGPGIQVINYNIVQPGMISVRVRVQPNAKLGSRTVKVQLPNGLHTAKSGLFFVTTQGATSSTNWDLYE